MSSLQRVIKYCAIGFAVFLTVMIISGIISAVFAIVSFIPGGSIKARHWRNEETVNYNQSFEDVESLNINHSFGELRIRVGESFRVEAENVPESFEVTVDDNGKLSISEDDDGFQFLWFNFKGWNGPNAKITLYVPANFIADKAVIDAGAGNISIEGLQADSLEISAGAGNINGSNLVAKEVDIDGGVGNISLEEVDFTDAVFDSGVGNLNISGRLYGDTEISCGIGEVDLNLEGNVDDYGYDVDSGIGSIRLNGEKISGRQGSKSNEDNNIQVDGGIGNVSISFDQE